MLRWWIGRVRAAAEVDDNGRWGGLQAGRQLLVHDPAHLRGSEAPRPGMLRWVAIGVVILVLCLGTAPEARALVVVCANCEDEPTALFNEAQTIARWLRQEADNLKAYTLQYQQYLTQVQTYYTDLNLFINWVHNPTLGGALGLMQAAGLGAYLPVQPMAMLGLINGLQSAASGNLSLGGISAIFGSLNALTSQAWSTNHIYTPDDTGWDSQQINAGAASIAGMQGGAMNAYQGFQNHMADQQALRDHLVGLSSPKDVEDTQAQIALEQAWTENQNGQLLSAMAAYMAQEDSRQQRDIEATTMAIDNYLAATGTGLN
jgi:hypothetical protein